MRKKKLFDIIIRNIKYPVYNLSDKNDDTKWVEISSYPIYNDFSYIEYTNNINKFNWDISIKMGNSISSTNQINREIKGYIKVILKLNDVEIYSFFTNSIDNGYIKIRNVINKLEKIPIDLYDIKSIKGKHIYYKGLPCKIDGLLSDGLIIISADCDKNIYDKWWDSLIEPWFDEKQIKEIQECKHYNKIKVDIIDDNIHWIRNDRMSKLMKIKRKLFHS